VNEADSRERVLAFLHQQRFIAEGEPVTMVQLGGGVSSDLWRVHLPSGEDICVKTALAQLKVRSQWFAPVSRNHIEYEWLTFAARVRPRQVPRVLAHDESAGLFAMEYLPPDEYPVWKTVLLAGWVDPTVAVAVGDLIGGVHAASAADPTCVRTFATDSNFDALRIAPYFRATAIAHPDLSDRLADLAQTTASVHLAVVHGDLSPKNILVGAGMPVLLDAECAWFGDPAFDLAFCLNHLLLKSIKLPEHGVALRAAGLAMLEAHRKWVDWEPARELEIRVTALLPALALARIDGSSPVEYLDEPQRSLVREASRQLIPAPGETVSHHWDLWTALTHARGVAA